MEPPDPDDDLYPPNRPRPAVTTVVTIAVVVVLLAVMVVLHLAGARPSH